MKNNNDKNILEFCLSPALGGLELCVVDFYNYFNKQNNCKIIVAPNKRLDDYFENDNNKYTIKRNKLFPIIPALKLAKFIDKNDIDIVHFHWTKDIATVILAKVLSRKKPKILQSRHMTMTRFKDDFYHKWLYKNIDIIHAVTNQVKEQIIKYIPSDIRPEIKMVYLGADKPIIDIDKVNNLKVKYNLKDKFVVGIIGRIEEGKGQYLVIDAIKKLNNENIVALIVGNTMDTNYLDTLKQKIKDHNIANQIIFTGFTKDVSEHIKLCDVTVLATPKETFGLVVIESMINGVPVIATNNGGPLEIIDDMEDGLFFNRTAEDLITKINLLANDDKLKQKLIVNSTSKVDAKFNKEKQMMLMEGIIY